MSEADAPSQTGFAHTPDGLRLYWRTVGSGPVVACCNGVGVSTFFWKYLVAHFRDRYTFLLWDYRGHGLSDRDIDPTRTDLSVGRHAEDLALVLEAAGANGTPAVVVGHSLGCQVAIELKRRHPERVRGIVLMLGTAGRALSTFMDNPKSPRYFRLAHRVIGRLGRTANEVMRPLLESQLSWSVATRFALVDPIYCAQEDMAPYMQHLASLDQRMFIEAVMQMEEHDAWDFLPDLGCPLLVIAAENDKFTPMWCSRKIVAITPGAEMLVLADASHAALIEQPESINRRVDRWLRERVERSE